MGLFNHDNLHRSVELLKKSLKNPNDSVALQKAITRFMRVLGKKEYLLADELASIKKIKEPYDHAYSLVDLTYSKVASMVNDHFHDDEFTISDEAKFLHWYAELIKDFDEIDIQLKKIRHLEHRVEKDEHKLEK